LNTALYAFESHRETGDEVMLGAAHFTSNLIILVKVDSFRLIGTGEMVSTIALFVVLNRAEKCCSRLVADLADARFEFIVCLEEVEDFPISCLFHFFGPQGAVDMDELIDVIRNESPRYFSFAIQFAEDAPQSLLGVVYQNVFILTAFIVVTLI
jgi:hypothetical protein